MEWLFGFLGVIVGSLVAGYKDVWLDLWHRKKVSEHLAIQIISDLDCFIDSCSDIAADNGLCHGQLGSDGVARVQAPTPKMTYSIESHELRIFPAGLMYQVLSFPTNVKAANRIVDYKFEWDDGPYYGDAFEERQYQYALLGLKAYKIINELKLQYKFPEDSFEGHSSKNYLEEKKKEIEENRMEAQLKVEKSDF